MKITVKELLDNENPCGYVLLHAIGGKANEIVSTIPERPVDERNDDRELNVTLSVNGVELDVKHLLNELYNCIVINSKKFGKEMFDKAMTQKCRDIEEQLYELHRKCNEINECIDWDDIYNNKIS